MFSNGLLSYSNRDIYMHIINGPITNCLVFLFIKAELRFIRAGTQTKALIVQMIQVAIEKLEYRNPACL